jgi:hypothetical protein
MLQNLEKKYGELMDNGFITKELGENHPYPEELFEIAMKFTMAFYLSTLKIFKNISDFWVAIVFDYIKDIFTVLVAVSI